MMANCVKHLLNERKGWRHVMVSVTVLILMVTWWNGPNCCSFPDEGGALCMMNGWFTVAEEILQIGVHIKLKLYWLETEIFKGLYNKICQKVATYICGCFPSQRHGCLWAGARFSSLLQVTWHDNSKSVTDKSYRWSRRWKTLLVIVVLNLLHSFHLKHILLNLKNPIFGL